MGKIKETPLVIVRDSKITLKAMEKLRIKIAKLEAENKALRKENEFLRNQILARLDRGKNKEKLEDVVKRLRASREVVTQTAMVEDSLPRVSEAFLNRVAHYDPFAYEGGEK